MTAEKEAGESQGTSKSSFNQRAIWIISSVIVLDQASKIAVLKTMERQESISIIGDWFRFTFTENPGMAFGIEYGPASLITIFSIAATGLIILYLRKVGHIYTPYRLSLALVLGGAIGNIIDRLFYGMILYDAPLFSGKVVDFIHINAWRGFVPENVPLLGGKYLQLFPIWNVADMAIVLGVVGILVFQSRFHEKVAALEESDASTETTTDATTDGDGDISADAVSTQAES